MLGVNRLQILPTECLFNTGKVDSSGEVSVGPICRDRMIGDPGSVLVKLLGIKNWGPVISSPQRCPLLGG